MPDPKPERKLDNAARFREIYEDLFTVKTGVECTSAAVRARFEEGAFVHFLVTNGFDIYVSTEIHEDIERMNGVDTKHHPAHAVVKKMGLYGLKVDYYVSDGAKKLEEVFMNEDEVANLATQRQAIIAMKEVIQEKLKAFFQDR